MSCSRFSALPMTRFAIILILFAALGVETASGAQPHKTRSHHAPAATVHHSSGHSRTHHTASRTAHGRLASRRIRHASRGGHAQVASARRPKPAHRMVAPRTTQHESASPAAPAQSAHPLAHTGGSDQTLSDAPADAAAQEASPAAERVVASRIATRTADLLEPEPESDPDAGAPQVIEGDAQAPVTAVSLHATRFAPVAPLHGSLASLVRQNERTDEDHLERIENDDDLRDRIARGVLVPVPTSSVLSINKSLPSDRRYCRPWTARFLSDLARAHAAQFHRPLEVSSAVRTVDYQKRLIGVNGSAAAAEGDVVSPHVTGATIDIAKGGLSTREIYWMRSRLLKLQDQGKLDVEEEFQQACFHITVYKSYAAPPAVHGTHRHLATPVSAPASAPVGSSEDTSGE